MSLSIYLVRCGRSVLWGSIPHSLTMRRMSADNIYKHLNLTIMTKQELANEKRLNNAVINSSCTKPAQLKSLSHECGYQLQAKDKDGNITLYSVTKREQLSKLGLEPKVTSKGAILGYTPAVYNDATAPELKVIGTDGKVKANYVFVDRVVKVSVGNDATGIKEESLYTSEEADKKVKGESAQTIKVYRKCIISEYGWSPRLLVKVLEQSRNITAELERAKASAAKWDELKQSDLYIVQNRDGKLVKIKVRVEDAAI